MSLQNGKAPVSLHKPLKQSLQKRLRKSKKAVLFKALKDNDGKIMSETSFSLSAMLGTCFINKEVVDSFSVSTWGIYFSGDHFKAVDKIVKQWSEEKKAAHGD